MAGGNEVAHGIRSAFALRDYVGSRSRAVAAVVADVVVTGEDSGREPLPRTAVASGSGLATLARSGIRAASPARELAERAGHSKPSMSLDVYSHVMPTDEVGEDRFLALIER